MRIAQAIFSLSWKLAILLWPWQTRFFVEGSAVLGLPWEQGRLSFYASWIPMLLSIIIGLFLFKVIQVPLARKRWAGIIGFILLLCVSAFTDQSRATIQWWMEIAVLTLFCWTLIRARVSTASIVICFVLSLIPHAFMGIWQYADQSIQGSKWLGIATQDPLARGVSVLEVGGRRILRAYGGFPHPNIFGGWLVIGILCLAWLQSLTQDRNGRMAAVAAAVLFSDALVLTFSRSAWAALAFGLAVFGVVLCIRERKQIKPFLFFVLMIVLTMGVIGFSRKEIIMPRISVEGRLETKSIDERLIAWEQGWTVFRERPWIGSGPGSYNAVHQTLVPPHNVFLLALDEVGVIGFIGLAWMMVWAIRRHRARLTGFTYACFAVLLVVGLLDYYLWSFWSGKALVFFVAFLAFFSQNTALDMRGKHSA